jgi:hypothetical protein
MKQISLLWKAFKSSSKPRTFMRTEEGKYPKVDEALLYFVAKNMKTDFQLYIQQNN